MDLLEGTDVECYLFAGLKAFDKVLWQKFFILYLLDP